MGACIVDSLIHYYMYQLDWGIGRAESPVQTHPRSPICSAIPFNHQQASSPVVVLVPLVGGKGTAGGSWGVVLEIHTFTLIENEIYD